MKDAYRTPQQHRRQCTSLAAMQCIRSRFEGLHVKKDVER